MDDIIASIILVIVIFGSAWLIWHEDKIAIAKAKEKEIIIKFLKQMSSQDNRMTAFPYFYVIRTLKTVAAYEGCESFYEYLDDDSDCPLDIESILEDEEEYDALSSDPEENKDGKIKWSRKVGSVKEWENKGMFLTETDAKDHLRLNYYHYSKDAYTYVDHSWRAPELEGFLSALFKHFKVKPQRR